MGTLEDEFKEHDRGSEPCADELKRIVLQDYDDVFVWSSAAIASPDVFAKKYFLDGMMECIESGGRLRYMKGLFATNYALDQKELNKRIAEKFVERYPLSGRIILNLPPTLFFCQR